MFEGQNAGERVARVLEVLYRNAYRKRRRLRRMARAILGTLATLLPRKACTYKKYIVSVKWQKTKRIICSVLNTCAIPCTRAQVYTPAVDTSLGIRVVVEGSTE